MTENKQKSNKKTRGGPWKAKLTEEMAKQVQALKQARTDIKELVTTTKKEQKALNRERNQRKWIYAQQALESDGAVENASLLPLHPQAGSQSNPVPYYEVSDSYTYPEISEIELIHSHWLRGALHYMDGYFFSRLYPGQSAVPLIHSNEPVPAHNSIVNVTLTKGSTAAEWIFITCSSVWGSMNDGPGISLLYSTTLPTSSNSIATSTVLATQPWTDWYGSTMDTFTSGCIIWATQLSVSLECAMATLAGSAYVGAISYGQWITGVPTSALLARAEKIDLKSTGGRVTMRNLIQNTALAYNPPSGGSISLGAARGEMVSYMMIHAPALSLTGSLATVTPVVSVSSNYLWWSDLSNILLDQIVLKTRSGQKQEMLYEGTVVTPEMMSAINSATAPQDIKDMMKDDKWKNTVAANKTYLGKPVNRPAHPSGRKLGMVSNAAKAIGMGSWNSLVKKTPWLGDTLGKTYGPSSQMSSDGAINRIKKFLYSLIEDMSPADLAAGGLSMAGLMDSDVQNLRQWTETEVAGYLSGIVKLTRLDWINPPPGWHEKWDAMIAAAEELLAYPTLGKRSDGLEVTPSESGLSTPLES